MKLNKKSAQSFASTLTVAQLKRAVVAYARGIPFEKTFSALQVAEQDELPEYLHHTRKILLSPCTAAELARKLHCTKDTAWTYLAKLRQRGVRVHAHAEVWQDGLLGGKVKEFSQSKTEKM